MATATKGLIFLETGHPILLDFFTQRAKGSEKPDPADVKIADFDNVQYHLLVSADKRDTIKFSVQMDCLSTLSSMGAKSTISKLYSGLETKTEQGYHLTLDIPVSKLDKTLIKNLSEIKRNLMASPFDTALKALASGGASGVSPMAVTYRKSGEQVCLVPSSDRVMVIYSVNFQDEADRAIARVFLQEFAEAQRHVSNAPNVSFSVSPPGDLVKAKVKGFKESRSCVGYIMFQVFKSHVESSSTRARATTLFVGFRSYLHYHIKASKAHLHSRMRRRVALLLKVLNRANPEVMENEIASKARPFARKL